MQGCQLSVPLFKYVQNYKGRKEGSETVII